MPLYDYRCRICGPFHEWRSMVEWEANVPCPTCSLPAPRRAAAPMLAVLSSNNRVAHEHNERSAHEPKVVRRQDLPPDHRHHGHQHGVSPLIRQQLGDAHASMSGRPWMVGH
jgi:putative FmdB family regulatory protein